MDAHTATLVLQFGTEISFGSIAGPHDFVDVYVDGNPTPNAIVEWRVYGTVNGVKSLLAKSLGASKSASVLVWEGSQGSYSPIQAGASDYELRAYWAQQGVPPSMKASIVGYDEFSTSANVFNSSSAQVPAGFATVALATAAGYCQSADVSVNQNFAEQVNFTLYALSEVGGVEAPVPGGSITLNGNNRVNRVLSNLKLPGAVTYTLRASMVGSGDAGPVVQGALSAYSTTAGSAGHTYALAQLDFTATSANVLAALQAAGQLPAAGTIPITVEGYGGGQGGGGGGKGTGGNDGDGAMGATSALYQRVTVLVDLAQSLNVAIGDGGAGNASGVTTAATPPVAGSPTVISQPPGTTLLAALGGATSTAFGAAGGTGGTGSSGAAGTGGGSPALGEKGDSFLGPGGPAFVWLGGAGGAAGAAGAGGGGGAAGPRGSAAGGATGGKGGDGSAVGAPGGPGQSAAANTGAGGGGGGGGSNTGTTLGGIGGNGGSGWARITVLVQTS